MSLPALFDVPAPAKLNLFLHVVGRRDDGYHLIDSLMLPIDWCDTLHFERRSDGRLARHDLGDPLPADDLCLRAARALQQAAGMPLGADISIEKRLPSGAGLGGGSSDAASTLLALNRLWGLDWPLERLLPIGLALGADVPFFLDPRPAWVTGIGEKREPVAGMPALALLLANPGLALATAEVFRAFDALAPKAIPSAGAPRALARELADDRSLAARLHNDLEEPAVRLCPPIARLRAQLRATGARAVGMSGSGATLYGVYADRAGAERAATALTQPGGGWARVATTWESR